MRTIVQNVIRALEGGRLIVERPSGLNLKVVQCECLGQLDEYREAMRYVSDSEAKQRFAALPDTVKRELVTIRRQNHEVAVVISPTDFNRLRSTNIKEFRRFCDRVSARAKVRGLTQDKFRALLNE